MDPVPLEIYQAGLWIIYAIASVSFISLISLGRLTIKRFLKDSKYETALLEFWIENIDHASLSYFILKLISLIAVLLIGNSYQSSSILIIFIPVAVFEIFIYVIFYHSNIRSHISLYSVILLRSVLLPYFLLVKYLYLFFDKLSSRLRSDKGEDTEESESENEIEDIIIEDSNLLDKDERKMIMSIIQFNDTTAKEVMTPRTDLACIEVSSSAAEIIELINREGHSRIPVYEEKIDNIVGIFYAKDLLKEIKNKSLDSINIGDFLRSAYFVPETKNISTLLKEFMRDEVHIAIVVDEYGGTAGVVSIEDLIEEIVGEIRDEYDYDEDQVFKKLEDNSVLFDAKADIEILEDLFDIEVPEDDFESIGGLVFSIIGRVPKPGEILKFENLILEIVEADDRKISKIKVKKDLQVE